MSAMPNNLVEDLDRVQRSDATYYWLLFVLNYPLVSELLRKYLFYSEIPLLVGDIFVLSSLIIWLRGVSRSVQLPKQFYVSALFLLLWSLATIPLHGNLLIGAVGVRAVFIPYVYLLVSAYFVSRYSNGARALLNSAALWVALIAAIAFAQLYLGRDHPINSLPGALENTGIGDYTVLSGGLGLDYIFRPASIFLHTGKFGQILFTLVLFKWLILYSCPPARTRVLVWSIPVDIICVFISGQRGAMLFLTVSLVFVFILERLRARNRSRKQLLILGLLSSLGAVALYFVLPAELTELVTRRYLSAFSDSGGRIEQNLLEPIAVITKQYGIVGEGLGFFTLGARNFGGALLYESVPGAGIAENSWLRLIAELGLLGAVLFAATLVFLIGKAVRLRKVVVSGRHRQTRAASIFAACWLLSISAWAITHDVFSNSVGASVGMALCGSAFAVRVRRRVARLSGWAGSSRSVCSDWLRRRESI